MKKLLSFLLCLQFLIMPVMAQEGGEGGSADDDLVKTTQQDILIVAGAAGAGAILGLSTLSFVDQPSRHLRNVYSGAAIGMIVGVIFVAYNSAQRGTEELQNEEEASIEFNTSERLSWHEKNAQDLTLAQVHFGTNFLNLTF